MTRTPGGVRSPGTRAWRTVELREHRDRRGALSVVEAGIDVGFAIRRAYYFYDVPASMVRGAHGHRSLHQLLVAVHGRFDVLVDDGVRQDRFRLDRPARGLYIGPMVWRSLVDFSPGAVGLVLASTLYDESDYFHDYGAFLKAVRGRP
ncbi:FdtA/QdtA family cupin domain-containing protein [Actinomadura viridis]|uniref:dTDP-4-dehydrorhamnose 3,5-epimerase-like enzyme n=1 Tax=Actinomadura viridis TaxID=58110 RepID=A0A931DFZ3_9ACTN|nr:FdtA/QdtA family cupin domain-containing protein [Actinomadura viridis]MBG6086851.1 dTDP-4-dehydrorhamnose 3,5-epimerase-like enzyme [Actinomadura viridis]